MTTRTHDPIETINGYRYPTKILRGFEDPILGGGTQVERAAVGAIGTADQLSTRAVVDDGTMAWCAENDWPLVILHGEGPLPVGICPVTEQLLNNGLRARSEPDPLERVPAWTGRVPTWRARFLVRADCLVQEVVLTLGGDRRRSYSVTLRHRLLTGQQVVYGFQRWMVDPEICQLVVQRIPPGT
jgi:hypothetical protein